MTWVKWCGAALAAVLMVVVSTNASAGGKTKKGKKGPAPAEISRSNKAPSAYHLFLTPAKDNAKAGEFAIKVTGQSISKAFTRPGYIIDTPAEGAPKDSTELAKWLRDKDRTGLKFDLTLESLTETKDKEGNTLFNAKVKATVFTSPSGWMVMSTSGEAGAVSDGMMLDKDLQEAAINAAVGTLVENIANYLTKKPVPIDR